MAGLALVSPLGLTGQANADAAYTVSGKINCINSADPVGVWVEAPNGGSGWAKRWLDVSDGWGYGHYSKALPNGGPFRLHVGCGGTPQKWGMTAYSDFHTGGQFSVVCNDLNPLLARVAKRVLPAPLKWADLSQGIPYGHCKQI